jgi:hypothetical protein
VTSRERYLEHKAQAAVMADTVASNI